MHLTRAMDNRLRIRGLSVVYGKVPAVSNLDIDAAPGEVVAVVGESGAGKSSVGAALLDLVDPPGRWNADEMRLDGVPIDYSASHVRGRDISVIFQDPQTALNPLFTVESQLVHMVRHHLGLSKSEARTRAVEMLEEVGIPDAEARVQSYPHQFSGGMRQRVVIALALACKPRVVIADEPTSALDVSVRAQILRLIRTLCQNRGMACLLITHDMGAVAEIADRAVVMRHGASVETGTKQQILSRPMAPYSRTLIAAVPPSHRRIDRFALPDSGAIASDRRLEKWLRNRPSASKDVPLSISGLGKVFGGGRFVGSGGGVRALDDVSFEIGRGEIFGLVGESGSGKSTLAQIAAGLLRPTSGEVRLLGKPFGATTHPRFMRAYRSGLQMVFQDPFSSLNRRMSVMEAVMEPMQNVPRSEALHLVTTLLERVGLPADAATRKPHAFSGGQRQRIAIARALAGRPDVLICDEPTSALDVSIQAQILNLLKDLRDDLGLSMLFITHDLPVVRQMCDRVGVLHQGRLVEVAATETLFETPKAAYSQDLISYLPRLPDLQPLIVKDTQWPASV
ncbi:dipeptide ABC transporter ATP-binding protein [Roseobacter sp.]|uniref:dipeptide ABC transporter ATP-binding protein n=1 Tax=Roseobacter sp. TaxID=1907202 RepID=UPI0038592C0C